MKKLLIIVSILSFTTATIAQPQQPVRPIIIPDSLSVSDRLIPEKNIYVYNNLKDTIQLSAIKHIGRIAGCPQKELTMKRFVTLLAIISFTVSTALSIEQIPDILIIGNDTIYLQSFPLERFDVYRENLELLYPTLNTECWRGYVATWEIIDGYLVLKEIKKYKNKNKHLKSNSYTPIDKFFVPEEKRKYNNNDKINVVKYLKRNGYTPKIINGFVVADWYSETLRSKFCLFVVEGSQLRGGEKFEASGYVTKTLPKSYMLSDTDELIDTKLVFENGKLVENNVIPIADYKIGETLSFLIFINEYGKYTRIQGVIKENNGKMVRLELPPLVVEGKTIEIKQEILDNFWVNPRYCRKVE